MWVSTSSAFLRMCVSGQAGPETCSNESAGYFFTWLCVVRWSMPLIPYHKTHQLGCTFYHSMRNKFGDALLRQFACGRPLNFAVTHSLLPWRGWSFSLSQQMVANPFSQYTSLALESTPNSKLSCKTLCSAVFPCKDVNAPHFPQKWIGCFFMTYTSYADILSSMQTYFLLRSPCSKRTSVLKL